MIKLGTWQNAKAALLLRRLPTGNDRARHRDALDNPRIDQSPLRDATSAYRNRPIQLDTPSTASQIAGQRTSATDRQRRNPHSV
jgi:hypothetical protein